MSSRALRRQQRELGGDFAPADDDATDIVPVKKNNLFSLMGGDSGSDEEEEEEDGKEKGGEEQKEQGEKDEGGLTPKIEARPVRLSTKAQKKRNRRKKKSKTLEAGPNSDDELDRILATLKADKTIDTTTQEYQSPLQDNTTHDEIDPDFKYFTPAKQVRSAKLLSVAVKDLDPDNEFKKLFGNLSPEAISDADSTTSTSLSPEQLQQIRRLAKVIRGWGGRDRRSIPGTGRKLVLTKVRDDWIPTQQKDMTMVEITPRELVIDIMSRSEDWEDVIGEDVQRYLDAGIHFYRFTRPKNKADSQFYQSVVLVPNHENLMALLSINPYHVETILQAALIFVRQGDKSNTNGLIERALFAFDRGFKQSFDIATGLSRLPFNYYLNRQFHLALFRYIEVLTKKGTYATALTYCKVLLGLNPGEDPLGVRYFIDFYALLAGEEQYLLDFISSPLTTTYNKWFPPGLAYSAVLAYLRLGKKQEALEALKVAFMKHPFVGYKLLEAIGLGEDIPVYDYSVFEVGEETESVCEAYLIRAHILWNDSKERNFLHDELLRFAGECRIFEQSRDGIIPVNFLRFAVLSGEGRVMAKIPAAVWENNEIFEYDVLPPKEGNVEVLKDFVDNDLVRGMADDERMMEMIQRLSLQELIETGVDVDVNEEHLQ